MLIPVWHWHIPVCAPRNPVWQGIIKASLKSGHAFLRIDTIDIKLRSVSKMGKRYEKEYKEYIAKLVIEEGRKRTELSYEMDIPYKTISRWVGEYKASLLEGSLYYA